MPSGRGGSSSSSSAPACPDTEARAPHEIGGPAVEYQIVIPTRGRWRPACEISPSERALKHERKPFIIVKTLAFLKRQAISPARVTLYVADTEEEEKYKVALTRGDGYWKDTQIRVGKPGILDQRNHIVNSLPEGAYVVSFDDDVSDIKWKLHAGSNNLQPLTEGMLEKLIFHAHATMQKRKSFIWGLNATASLNFRIMWSDGISTRNGEVNGFCYGFINRHLRQLQPQIADATEDAERSLRFFRQDGIILRYRMYAGETKCFKYEQGLQEMFPGNSLAEKNQARKDAERAAADRIVQEFPRQVKECKQKKGTATLEIKFRHIGGQCNGIVLPVTTKDALTEANRKDYELKNPNGSGSSSGRGRPQKKQKTSEAASIETSREDEAKGERNVGRRGPATPSRCKGSPSRDAVDSEEETSDEEGESENRAMETVLQQLQRGQYSEEDALQKATEDSIRDMVHFFNGDVEDPMNLARQNSLLTHEEDKRRQASQQEAEDFALAMSLAEGPVQIVSDSPPDELAVQNASPSGSMSAVSLQHSHAEESPDGSFDLGLARLIDMNFDPGEAAHCLRDSRGDVEQAISMLVK